MSKSLYDKYLTIPSTVEGLDLCLFIVKDVSILFDLDFEKKLSLHTVVVEAVENAIIHGNKENREKIVKFSIHVFKDIILLQVEDEGDGFNINDIVSPLLTPNLKKESGRGIFFIKSLSDSCVTLGKGNIIKVIMRR